jgi:uncharacterized glyoxalase superfamily protein PhnB
MPPGDLIPEMAYSDVLSAAEWLCKVFGFRERLRIGTHRIQLTLRESSMVVVERAAETPKSPAGSGIGIMVRVEDVDRHFQHAKQAGATILSPPTDFFYGERQYNVVDPGGYRWTFSQSISDVDPQTWNQLT